MIILILGLVFFLGAHSVRIVAEPWRVSMIARVGPLVWKAVVSLVSLVGLVLIVQGYPAARAVGGDWWALGSGARHTTVLLTFIGFILMAAAYVPRNAIRARLHHPMVLGVKLWAAGHLLSNGSAADVVLFGAVLLWAVLDFRSARRRDAAVAGGGDAPGGLPVHPPPSRLLWPTLITVGLGTALWAGFALYLHARWIGVNPLV